MVVTLLLLFPLVGFLINGIFGRKLPKVIHGAVGTGAVVASFICALLLYFVLLSRNPSDRLIEVYWWDWMTIGEFYVPFKFIVDPLSSFMLLIITGIGSLIHLYSTGYMKEDPSTHRFFAYLNLFVFSMMILVTGSSLLTMFIGWEGVGLCSYLLIGFWHQETANADAGKKAFITNRIGDLGVLLGAFTLFALTGSLEFSEINDAIAAGGVSPLWITAACLLLFVGACGKSAQIPLYVWLPDAMAGPTPVSALIHAATMVTAGVFLIARLNGLFIESPEALQIIMITGAATALFAATIGLVQNDIKKVLAYSTVSQLGFMFVAMGTGNFVIGIFHLMTHAFFKACLFLGSGSVIHGNHHEQDMRFYGGLEKPMKITYITYLISTFAIAGFPATSGFFSKDEILWYTAAGFHGSWIIYGMLLLAAFFTATYMARTVVMTFKGEFRGDHHTKEHLHESPWTMTVPLMILSGLALVGGFLNYPKAWPNFGIFPQGILHYWLEPSLRWSSSVIAERNLMSPAMQNYTLELVLVIVSVVVGLLGLLIGYRANMVGGFATGVSRKFAQVHKVLWNKYYVDEFYQAVVLKPLWYISDKVFFRIIDRDIVDGLVNGVGKLGSRASRGFARLQNGDAHWYAFYLVLGLGFILYVALNISIRF